MSYTINLTDGALFATIADGTINTASSMTLVGKNYAGYGQFLDTNFIHLLENASNTTPPGAPLTGQLWWDSGAGLLKVYQGSTWKSVSAATSSTSAPSTSTSVAGDLWYDSTNAQLNVYTGDNWLLVGPQSSQGQGTSGAIVATVLDNQSVSHVVIELYVKNDIVGIVSKDATFTPQPAISGFTTIRPGITLSTLIGSQVPLFQGTATSSQALNGLSSTSFMRADANTSTSGSLLVQNNSGLTVGLNSDFNANVSGTTVTLKNTTSNGNLNIGVNVGGTPTNSIMIDGITGAVSIPSFSLGAANISLTSLGVGTAATGVTGEIVATNNVTAYYSDDRLKTRLGDIKNALDAVTSLTGFYYEANQTAQDLGYTAQREVGLSAQDVQRVLPEVVVPAPIDSQYLTIRYEKMIPLLVQAIKELNDKIDNLSK